MVLVYLGSLIGLLVLYSLADGTTLLYRFLEYNAQATGFLAGALGADIQVIGNNVVSSSFAISIVDECTSLAPFAIFAAGILAVPATLSRKAAGIILGFVALGAINLARTTSLFYIGLVFPAAMDMAHLLVWQSVMVIASVGLWLAWIRQYGYAGNH